MDRNALDKFIGKLILPQYPWINNHKVLMEYVSPVEHYKVNYYVTKDWMKQLMSQIDKDDENPFIKEMREVQELTRNAFMGLGFGKNQMLDKVDFFRSIDFYKED